MTVTAATDTAATVSSKTLTGVMLIGAAEVKGTHGTMRAFNPTTAAEMAPEFFGGGEADAHRACTLAAEAFDRYRETSLVDRAAFLRAIGAGLLELGDTLIDRAQAESGLPKARLEGERGRTIGQLEMFAKIVEGGRWVGAVIDTALPDRKPMARIDLRLRRIPLGPVAVFGASNFPLAFSVAGGDTASALAAGCPVVAKSHPAHLGTSELVGRVIQAAVKKCGLPEGVFSLVLGEGNAIGQALVLHPAIKAVGFTGSRRGGLSLVQSAAGRPEPIPVYAEMSSTNPMFLLAGALAKDAAGMAKGFVDSLTLGVGQFCTNPGLAVAIAGPALDAFRAHASDEIPTRAPGTMLSPGIQAAYQQGIEKLSGSPTVKFLAGAPKGDGYRGAAALFEVAASDLLQNPVLGEEVFGPSSVLVTCKDEAEMLAVAEHMEGQLTASLMAETSDATLAAKLLPILERRVGRIVYNGFPTGVEVAWAMVHGGPFPATSDSRSTSVGAGAIDRFLRPVSYQNFPDALLPASLQESNPLELPRVRDTVNE
jgi:alpha-ketoglutaric semialdehyde dehydrogenase